MDRKTEIIDLNALKFNQLSIVALVLSGFIFDSFYLPAFVAVIMIVGSLFPNAALFKRVYKHLIVPLGLMKPEKVEDLSAPHNFAQLLGGIVLATSSVFLFTHSIFLGWVLSWVVIILALANLIFGFCAGCFIYYQMGKLNFPGFQSKTELE